MYKRIWTSIFVFLVAMTTSAQWADSTSEESPVDQVPAYNAAPPKKGQKLPSILAKDQLLGPAFEYPFQTRAYELASRIPATIYQQPCYCYCDRMGHNSLHSCYESEHAAHCSACLQELYYSYKMVKQHKTARQIRAGIIKGEWKKIDVKKAAALN